MNKTDTDELTDFTFAKPKYKKNQIVFFVDDYDTSTDDGDASVKAIVAGKIESCEIRATGTVTYMVDIPVVFERNNGSGFRRDHTFETYLFESANAAYESLMTSE